MTEDFQGKVAFVTGAASGLGFATAGAFAEAGANVALIDLDKDDVEDAAGRIGGATLAIACDVSDEASVEKAVARTISEFGRLDFAFNNAGVMVDRAETANASTDDFDRTIAVNLRGVWLCMKYQLQEMTRQGAGAIVNCSSMGGEVGGPGLSAYHASKHGVLGLTKTAGLEYAAKNIRVNAVLPGVFDTSMNDSLEEEQPEMLEQIKDEVPIGRLGKPEEVASAVLFLCGSGASMIIGHGLAVDGGFLAR
ncbi:glucose 1-dehydrogenase [Parvularcula oceani]|uniref:glucose 1-dehydrogenase n=1 Tax=Parvularcula oceani TaxID=1247963 RepID=UPI0004E1C2B6|nr:glucose 1-dehydrogenase [Parvularcula oceani]